MVKIILKRVGAMPTFAHVENDLKTLQKIVGGYIEVVALGGGLLLICNEEGKLDGLPPNFPLGYDVIVGDIFFIRSDDNGEFIDVLEADIETALRITKP